MSSEKRLHLSIFRLCFLVLFLELLFIRWLTTEISILAYLQNSVLVVCFLGLGMGLLKPLELRNKLSSLFVPLVALSLLLSIAPLRQVVNDLSPVLAGWHDFPVWGVTLATDVSAEKVLFLVVTISILFLIFLILWSIFALLGSRLGNKLQQTSRPLLAYSYDIAGSTCGIWLFTFLGFFSLPPWAWLLVLAGLLAAEFSELKLRQKALMFSLPVVSFLASSSLTDTFWTPYQKIEITPASSAGEFLVTINNTPFQQIQNLSHLTQIAFNDSDESKSLLNQYDLPSLFYREAREAMILGAGTGNDVAGLVRRTNARISAVEIDPTVLRLGKKFHPEKPYDNERVVPINDDARSALLATSPASVDLMVYGLLDSHSTPNLSNARLDNFVYTQEGISLAATRLRSNGIFFLIFEPQRDYIVDRLRQTIDRAFGKETMVFKIAPSQDGWGGVAFVNGDQERIASLLKSSALISSYISVNRIPPSRVSELQVTSDNWPYLYIERPSIPSLFWVLGSMIILLWYGTSKKYGVKFLGPSIHSPSEWELVFLGAAFSLVQVFSISKISVLFGSTWIVNSAAISGILIMILVANALAYYLPKTPSSAVGTVLIGLCLLLAVTPFTNVATFSFYPRFFVAAALSGLPMVFSGILFAKSFANSPDRARALGANLFGAMIGGVLQLIAFQFGINSLMLLAAVFYAGAVVSGSIIIRRQSVSMKSS